ncbi:hypothetical protein GCM10008986_35070 [Salinibacillus aidingensis]|uniref:Uncharacterized protein n=1 Tax=Salinibacillus aidingensis TaxID=237684 RepID=A0ABN1BS84_9BACI
MFTAGKRLNSAEAQELNFELKNKMGETLDNILEASKNYVEFDANKSLEERGVKVFNISEKDMNKDVINFQQLDAKGKGLLIKYNERFQVELAEIINSNTQDSNLIIFVNLVKNKNGRM